MNLQLQQQIDFIYYNFHNSLVIKHLDVDSGYSFPEYNASSHLNKDFTLRPFPALRLLLTPEMVRTATPFPMVSLLFVFTAFVISNIGHIQPQRTILAFVSGIFFILSGGTRSSRPTVTF